MVWEHIVGVLIPFLIPSTHIIILYYFWSVYAIQVRQQHCTCTCWDTIFKASFESGQTTAYKHMYFNATKNTMYMWGLVIVGTIASYEGFKKSIGLILRRSARFLMVFLFCISVVSQYIGWWDLINYINDDHYSQINYQVFMSLNELISTIYVLNLSNVQVHFQKKKLAIILALGIARVIVRFFNDFYGLWVFTTEEEPGDLDQLWSDLIKGVPDVVHILLTFFVMQMKQGANQRKRRNKRESDAYTMEDIFFIFNLMLFFSALTLIIVFRDMFF